MTSRGPDRAAERAAETAAREHAAAAARRVFGADARHSRGGSTRLLGSRPPTAAEQAAARRLARALRAAGHRERAATSHTAPTPPGRLRMREALAADAQRAAGAIPTAEPFLRTVRRHVPTPPLRLGVACDVSGSMHAVAHPLASAAWILARAASHVPDARAATVIFGATVRPVTHPGRTPQKVREFAATDGTEAFTDAADALDAALHLSRPGAARLLVVVSDGHYTPQQRRDGQQRITRLRSTGCGVLWLALDRAVAPMKGAHTVVLDDPAAADTIANAAISVLRGPSS